MKRDLSQETSVKVISRDTTLTANTPIVSDVVDLVHFNDILIVVDTTLTAGSVAVKIECSNDFDAITPIIQEIGEKEIKAVVKDGEIIRENKLEAIKPYFVDADDKKLISKIGILKDMLEYTKIRITLTPSVGVAGKASVVSVLNAELCPCEN